MATHTPEQLRAALADVLTLEQLADAIGVARSSIGRYRSRGDIPPEDATIGRTPVWFRPTVDAFILGREQRWASEQPGRGARRDRRRA
jgi:hypothetical protein